MLLLKQISFVRFEVALCKRHITDIHVSGHISSEWRR
jgi:hypothetical protein